MNLPIKGSGGMPVQVARPSTCTSVDHFRNMNIPNLQSLSIGYLDVPAGVSLKGGIYGLRLTCPGLPFSILRPVVAGQCISLVLPRPLLHHRLCNMVILVLGTSIYPAYKMALGTSPCFACLTAYFQTSSSRIELLNYPR